VREKEKEEKGKEGVKEQEEGGVIRILGTL
jgi:hypothetical protein